MEVGAGGAVNGRLATCGVGAGGDPRQRSQGLGRREASGGHTKHQGIAPPRFSPKNVQHTGKSEAIADDALQRLPIRPMNY